MSWLNLNGKLLQDTEAKISASDHGFLLGDGVFETLKALGGKILFFGEHIDRMTEGGGVLKIKLPYSTLMILRSCRELLDKSRLKNARIRITLTRGTPVRKSGLAYFDDKFKSSFLITAEPLGNSMDKLQTKGRRCGISSTRRNEFSPLSRIKCCSYLENLHARDEARRKGYEEAILLNSRRQVAECSMSNIFIVSGKDIMTPPVSAGALPGITAAKLIKVAEKSEIKIVSKNVTQEKLLRADEVFCTNSIIDVVPIISINGKKINGGKPGPITRKLIKIYGDSLDRS